MMQILYIRAEALMRGKQTPDVVLELGELMVEAVRLMVRGHVSPDEVDRFAEYTQYHRNQSKQVSNL